MSVVGLGDTSFGCGILGLGAFAAPSPIGCGVTLSARGRSRRPGLALLKDGLVV